MTEPDRRRWRLVRARSDAVPASVRRFTQRARRRRMRALVPWAIAAGVLVLVGSGWLVVYQSSVFAVRSVEISGVSLLTPYDVHEAAAVPMGRPLARVDLGQIRRRVAALAPVERVTVSRDWPAALRVRVTERVPAAAVPQSKQFLLIDSHGVAFQTVSTRPADLPLVRLAHPAATDLATRSALKVLTAMPEALSVRVAELVVNSPAGIELRLRDDRRVVWGDATESALKARTALTLLNHRGRVVDVSAPDVVTLSD